MKGTMPEKFGKEMVENIQDITCFVKEQKQLIELNKIDILEVPVETIYKTTSTKLNIRLGIEP